MGSLGQKVFAGGFVLFLVGLGVLGGLANHFVVAGFGFLFAALIVGGIIALVLHLITEAAFAKMFSGDFVAADNASGITFGALFGLVGVAFLFGSVSAGTTPTTTTVASVGAPVTPTPTRWYTVQADTSARTWSDDSYCEIAHMQRPGVVPDNVNLHRDLASGVKVKIVDDPDPQNNLCVGVNVDESTDNMSAFYRDSDIHEWWISRLAISR